MPYANNKDADQPAHPRSLISAFVVCCLDSIIPLVSIFEISSPYLVSVTAQTGLSLTWVANPGDRFSRDEAHIKIIGYILTNFDKIFTAARRCIQLIHLDILGE